MKELIISDLSIEVVVESFVKVLDVLRVELDLEIVDSSLEFVKLKSSVAIGVVKLELLLESNKTSSSSLFEFLLESLDEDKLTLGGSSSGKVILHIVLVLISVSVGLGGRRPVNGNTIRVLRLSVDLLQLMSRSVSELLLCGETVLVGTGSGLIIRGRGAEGEALRVESRSLNLNRFVVLSQAKVLLGGISMRCLSHGRVHLTVVSLSSPLLVVKKASLLGIIELLE